MENSFNRLRRLRGSNTLREMLSSVHLRREQLVAPLFVREGLGKPEEIASMPGQYQHSLASALETARRWSDIGLPAVLLFGIPQHKDATGSQASDENGIVQRLVRDLKRALPRLVVITDVCLCEYTHHGQCGLLADGKGANGGEVHVDNDATIELLARTAVSHAAAGADIVAPSAMMDGQVKAIRQGLESGGFVNTALLAYSAKFASCFYGPFRDAAQSAPQVGHRRGYQMDFRSPSQAVLEAAADIDEGADMIMVKPAWTYLDVIAQLRQRFDVPLAAYHVSGEYSALKAAARMGWLDERQAVLEVTTAIKRAGADIIITYFAEQLAGWL